METLHIVITWDSCGHIERDYVLISFSGNSYEIHAFVSTFYGRESGQYWRIATPEEREQHFFKTCDAISRTIC